jgi:hypothetical protein
MKERGVELSERMKWEERGLKTACEQGIVAKKG